MKTPEQALTEWMLDEVYFDYCDDRGPVAHNRDQFTNICKKRFIYDSGGISLLQNTVVSGAISASVVRPFRKHYNTLMCGSIMSASLVCGSICSGQISNPGAGAWEPERGDISEVYNADAGMIVANAFSVWIAMISGRFSGAYYETCLNDLKQFMEPQNVARYSTAKELVRAILTEAIRINPAELTSG